MGAPRIQMWSSVWNIYLDICEKIYNVLMLRSSSLQHTKRDYVWLSLKSDIHLSIGRKSVMLLMSLQKKYSWFFIIITLIICIFSEYWWGDLNTHRSSLFCCVGILKTVGYVVTDHSHCNRSTTGTCCEAVPEDRGNLNGTLWYGRMYHVCSRLCWWMRWFKTEWSSMEFFYPPPPFNDFHHPGINQD